MTTTASLKTLSALCVAGLLVSACSSANSFSNSQRISSNPQSLPPVQSSTVESSSLPPLQGQDGQVTNADGNIMVSGGAGEQSGDPALNGQMMASADGSFVSLDDVSGGTTPQGRDLSGGLSPEKLLGAWTVSGDLKTCRLNLTQTTKSGTNRYRASAPNCAIPTLALVSSWQLAGNQVQLYDEGGNIVGALQLSGNRFIGTLSGGIAATMEG